jgi:hypothetical protein
LADALTRVALSEEEAKAWQRDLEKARKHLQAAVEKIT